MNVRIKRSASSPFIRFASSRSSVKKGRELSDFTQKYGTKTSQDNVGTGRRTVLT